MKSNLIHTTIISFFRSAWRIIREAFSPNFLKDNYCEVDSQTEVMTSKVITDNECSKGNDSLQKDNHEATVDLQSYEEITLLRGRIAELERAASEQASVNSTINLLRQSTDRAYQGRVGRPPKPHIKISLNLQIQWSLLFELGRHVGMIGTDRNTFINEAIENLLRTQYPSLYAVYQHSISKDSEEWTTGKSKSCDIT